MFSFKKHIKNQNAINEFGFKCIDLLNKASANYDSKCNYNLIKIFFHELICFYTSTYITNLTNHIDHNKTELPYVNSAFLKNYKNHIIPDKRINKGFKNFLNFNFWSKKKVWISPTLNREEVLYIIKKSFYYKINFLKKNQLNLNNKEVDIYFDLIVNINRQLELPLTLNHLHCFLKYCQQFFSKEKNEESKYKGILLTGTTSKIQARILASKFLKNQQEVYAFGHGHGSVNIFKEPIFDYGEKWFCTNFIDYGITNTKKDKVFPTTFYRTSERIKYLNTKKIINKCGKKYLYVPTSLSSYKTYAPYRALYDSFYIEWQKQLINSLNKQKKFFRLKSHPKTNAQYDFIPREKLEFKSLDNCLDEYDFFIFDYVSTAFTEIISTEKKIFFFDINSRKISDDGIMKIKQDVNYMKINFNINIDIQIQKNLKSDKPRSFNYTNAFSLNKNPTKKTINKILSI